MDNASPEELSKQTKPLTLYSTKDAAKAAGVSLSTLRTYVRYGQIHPEKVGVGYVFTDTHIQQIKGVLKRNRNRRQQGLNDYLDTTPG